MIIDELRQKFPDMPNLRVRDIKADKFAKKVTCTVSYPDVRELSPEVTSAIRLLISQLVPQGYRSEVRFVNDKFNEKSFAATVVELLKKKYPLFAHVKADKLRVKIDGQNVFAEFCVTENTKKNMQAANLIDELTEFFRTFTCYRVQFSVEVVPSDNTQEALAEQEKLVQLAINRELLKPQRYFNVSDVVKHIGKVIHSKPMYISDVRSPMETCVVCGVISEKQLRAAKNNPTLHLCKFTLTDASVASITCVMFARFQIEDVETLKQTNGDKSDSEILTISKKRKLANEKKMKMLTFLSDGLEVIVRGKVVRSDFSGNLELQVYDICKCRIQPLNLQPQFTRSAPENYVLVQPQSVGEYRQLSFDKLGDKPSVLSNTHYVALFANITGLNATKDNIFAISAVRVLNGHVTEKFSTFVSSDAQIAETMLRSAGVSQRDLALSPTFTEIVGDLFKFVGDAIFTGVNLEVLLTFFNYYGAPLGYSFKNRVETQTSVLNTLFENSDFETRPNCAKLEDVVKFLKLNCKVSESAEDMALALAKCMSTLAEHSI